MKKQLLLSGTVLLVGCTSSLEDDSVMGEDVSEQESIEEDLDELMEEPFAIEFLPQENDLDGGLTVNNDPFLEEVADIVSETSADALALPGEVALFYTGITMEAENTDELRAIFLLTNRMNDTLKNIEVTFSFGENEENLLIDNGTIILNEFFGILSPYTARPVYIEIDPSKQQELEEFEGELEAYVTIEEFDYEIID